MGIGREKRYSVAGEAAPVPSRMRAWSNVVRSALVVQVKVGVTGASWWYQPGSSWAWRYWSPLVRRVTPRAARASSKAAYWSLRSIHPR